MVRDGTIGRILMARRRHTLATHTWPGFENSWHVSPRHNRDIWADDSSHAIDWMYWTLGMPCSVTAELGSLLNPKIPNDNGVAIFRYADGKIAEVCCSFTCVAGENTTEIVGDKGVIVQNYGDAPTRTSPGGKGPWGSSGTWSRLKSGRAAATTARPTTAIASPDWPARWRSSFGAALPSRQRPRGVTC